MKQESELSFNFLQHATKARQADGSRFLQQATKARTHQSIHPTFSTKICFLHEMVNGTTLPHENLFVNALGVIRPQKNKTWDRIP